VCSLDLQVSSKDGPLEDLLELYVRGPRRTSHKNGGATINPSIGGDVAGGGSGGVGDIVELLPLECVILILLKLDNSSVDAAALVCRSWHALISNTDAIWKQR